MRAALLLLAIATAGRAVAGQSLYCMSGQRCGDGCTMGNGRCINGRCFDASGTIEWACMAPMRRDFSFAWPWLPQQPLPWSGFRPWSFGPLTISSAPMFEQSCGGRGPCAAGQFCDAGGACRADTCANQHKFGCPGDTGKLKKVACAHFSGYKECYASDSGGFKCMRGPSGASLACASQSGNGGGVAATMAAGFSVPSATITEAGPAQAAATAVPGEGGARPAYLMDAGLAGPAQAPAIQQVSIAPDGSGMAAGAAAGDVGSVTTQALPGGGSSVVSSSFSSGSNQPAIASASATSGPPAAAAPAKSGL